MQLQEQIPEQALAWSGAGQRVALVTVIETWGSAPRRVGAQMAVAENGTMAGSVSGGCVEGAVVLEAFDVLETGHTRTLEYGVSDGDAFAVGLACGGTIRLLVEPIGPDGLSVDLLRDLVAARAARQPMVYRVALDGSARALERDGHDDRFRKEQSGLTETGDAFLAVHVPPPRLIIVGGVHIAQHLTQMGRTTGFDPIVVDPREAFGTPARFPQTRLVHDWPDQALADIGVDLRSAVVLLTHDPKLDDPALHIALRSPAFYIGALGSKRTHAARCARLAEANFTEEMIARIHGPIGLNIGAAGPAEIGVSILAQIIQALRCP
ncbi:MAG: XdhC family protein [Pseudomonadota bacterium]